MAVTLPPRPEDLINLSGNMSLLYPPGFFGASGSIITIIVLLVFTFILAIGNLVILVYLYKMGKCFSVFGVCTTLSHRQTNFCSLFPKNSERP